jgi:hypothetical protein
MIFLIMTYNIIFSPKGMRFEEIGFILAGLLEVSNEVFTHFLPTKEAH